MTAQAPDGLVVLVISGEPNFRRYARAVLGRAGHDVATCPARVADVAVKLRLTAATLVILDVDNAAAAAPLERVLARVTVVRVASDAGDGIVAKWDSATDFAVAVEAETRASARRALLQLIA